MACHQPRCLSESCKSSPLAKTGTRLPPHIPHSRHCTPIPLWIHIQGRIPPPTILRSVCCAPFSRTPKSGDLKVPERWRRLVPRKRRSAFYHRTGDRLPAKWFPYSIQPTVVDIGPQREFDIFPIGRPTIRLRGSSAEPRFLPVHLQPTPWSSPLRFPNLEAFGKQRVAPAAAQNRLPNDSEKESRTIQIGPRHEVQADSKSR